MPGGLCERRSRLAKKTKRCLPWQPAGKSPPPLDVDDYSHLTLLAHRIFANHQILI